VYRAFTKWTASDENAISCILAISIALGDPLLRFSYFWTSKRSTPALGHPAEKIEGVVRTYATVEADD